MYEQRKESLRKEYRDQLSKIPHRDRIYLDESSFDLSIIKTHGYSKKGIRLYGNITGNKRKERITVISAYSNKTKSLIAPMYFNGNTETTLFNTWLKEILLPQIQNQNKTIIMDNASFHKSDRTRALFKKGRLL